MIVAAILRTGVISIAIAAAMAWDSDSLCYAQQNAGFAFRGNKDCIDCHQPKEKPRDARITNYVAMNEANIWGERDKHSQAFAKLSGPRGQKMEALLNWGTKVTEDRRCLSCHANVQTALTELPGHEVLKDGVGCESCHGAASKYHTEHYFVPDDLALKGEVVTPARFKPVSEKLKDWGMVDVRNPFRRAEQCLSCHIGNAAQGKLLTHEMYAAGHPPLPSIEIETFAQQMPKHFRYFLDKKEFAKDLSDDEKAKIEKALGFKSVELHSTRAVMASAMIALRESAQLLLVNEDQLDFASYDCASCHHDLAAPGWRQTRGYGKRSPGRPQIKIWPTALVEVGIRHAARVSNQNPDQVVQEFEAKLADLRLVIAATPFGMPKELPGAVDDLTKWLHLRIAEIEANPDSFSAPNAVRVLIDTAKLGSKKDAYYDFDSARQIAWAFGTMYDEIVKLPGAKKALDKIKEPGANRPESINDSIMNSRRDLDPLLHLDLPSTTDKEREIMDHLQDVLNQSAAYDPEKFRSVMSEIYTALLAAK